MKPRWILGAGWIVFLLYAYPGYLGSDGANQLVDSRTGDFTDWQPPIMTEIWRLLGRVISGPPGMLLLQSGLLLFGAYLCARRVVSDRAAAIVASVVLVLPPAMATTAVITPEALLPGLMLCGIAALLAERRWVRLVGLGLVSLACGMHEAAPFAALPIVVALFVWRAELGRRMRLAIAVSAWLAAVLVAWGANELLLDLETEHKKVGLAIRDVMGTLQHAPPMSDDEVRSVIGDAPLAASSDLQASARANKLFRQPEAGAEREALYAARRAMTRAQPAAYLQFRVRVFLRLLGITKRPDAVYTDFVASRDHVIGLQHAARHSSVQRMLIAAVRGVSHTPLMRPVLYLVLAIVLLVFAVRRQQRLVAVLFVSAIAYEVSMFISNGRAEYRDSQWLIVASLAAAGMFLARYLEARQERVAD